MYLEMRGVRTGGGGGGAGGGAGGGLEHGGLGGGKRHSLHYFPPMSTYSLPQ